MILMIHYTKCQLQNMSDIFVEEFVEKVFVDMIEKFHGLLLGDNRYDNDEIKILISDMARLIRQINFDENGKMQY